MRLSRPTIVLFDMDGTTVRHIDPRFLHALEILDDMAYAAGTFWGRLRSGKNLRQAAAFKIPPHNAAESRLLVHRAIHRFRRKPVEQIVEPCPGILDVLERLRQARIPMAIVSNGLGRGYGHDILQKFGLDQYFSVRVFREDIVNSKPHPEPLIKALSRLPRPVTAQDTVWYIGDRRKDILAAMAAQKSLPCRVDPLSYGIHAAVTVLEHHVGADHIITSYHDLMHTLDQLLVQPFSEEETLL